MKNIIKHFGTLNLLFLIGLGVSVLTGNVLYAGLFWLLGASTNLSWKRGQMNACAVSCELGAISSSDDCNIRGGIKTAYWALYNEINWASMAVSGSNFDTSTQLIKDYIMVSTAKFKKLSFERKQGAYNFTYTKDSDVYTQLVTLIFEGKDNTVKNALTKAIGCCKIVFHIFDNNCIERILGVEWNGTTFDPQVVPLSITRHLDTSGEFGSSKARDEIDLGGESLMAPLYGTVGESNIPV